MLMEPHLQYGQVSDYPPNVAYFTDGSSSSRPR